MRGGQQGVLGRSVGASRLGRARQLVALRPTSETGAKLAAPFASVRDAAAREHCQVSRSEVPPAVDAVDPHGRTTTG
jgi:hypothetical protein